MACRGFKSSLKSVIAVSFGYFEGFLRWCRLMSRYLRIRNYSRSLWQPESFICLLHVETVWLGLWGSPELLSWRYSCEHCRSLCVTKLADSFDVTIDLLKARVTWFWHSYPDRIWMPPSLLAEFNWLDTLLSFLLNHAKQLLFLHPYAAFLLLLTLDGLIGFIIIDCNHIGYVLQAILHLLSWGSVTAHNEPSILALRQIDQIAAMLLTFIVHPHLSLAIRRDPTIVILLCTRCYLLGICFFFLNYLFIRAV